MAGLPQEGETFGRYDIVRKIGRGGMGVVYAALQHGLRREVALKLLSSDLADNEEYRHRFLREAEVLARLDSPHIISVYDAGEQDGWLYIATQLVPDGDVQGMLNRHGPMPASLALDLAAQIAGGLEDAHRAGIIHRDIKPSNVLLRRRRDGGLQAFVCDLGISRVMDAQHTKTQGVIGTFAYMAPERHEGHEATESSDLYAVGCMLWACLSGTAPYTGTDSQVLLGHLQGPIPQLSAGHPAAYQINEILRRTMAKNPAERFRSAGELRAACLAVNPPDSLPAPTTGTAPTFPPPQAMQQGGSPPPGSYPGMGSGPHSGPHSGGYSGPYSGPGSGPHSGASPGMWAPPPPPKRKGPLIAAVLVVLLLIAGGVTTLVLTLGDDGGDDTASEDSSESTDPSDDPTEDLEPSDAPTDASQEEFCEQYEAVDATATLEDAGPELEKLLEVGTPSDMDESERNGFVVFMETVEASTSDSDLQTRLGNLDASDRLDVGFFIAYGKSHCDV